MFEGDTVGSASKETELRKTLNETVQVIGDSFSLTYLLVSDGEKAEFVCRFLESAALLKEIQELELSTVKSVECYGLPLVLRILRSDPHDFHKMGTEMRELGLDFRIQNLKAEHGFEPTTDVSRFSRATKKVLNRLTSTLSDFHDRRRALPDGWTAFRRNYKKEIARANKYLSSTRTALVGGETAPPGMAAELKRIATLIDESRAAYNGLLAGGQVPAENREGWAQRFDRVQQRLAKLKRVIEP